MQKTYFVYRENNDWYYRENNRWDKLYFWWNPKFIVESLVDLFGVEKWKSIFDWFMEWIRNIKNMQIFFDWKETATFVLYRNRKNANKIEWSIPIEKIQGNKEEYPKNGEGSWS